MRQAKLERLGLLGNKQVKVAEKVETSEKAEVAEKASVEKAEKPVKKSK